MLGVGLVQVPVEILLQALFTTTTVFIGNLTTTSTLTTTPHSHHCTPSSYRLHGSIQGRFFLAWGIFVLDAMDDVILRHPAVVLPIPVMA